MSVTTTVESYLQMSECGIVAAAALLAFDYCLTIGQEVEWLYSTRWTIARIHFTSSRYLPFVAIAMAIPLSRVQSPSACGHLGTATNTIYYLCIVLAEAMIVVRTYAFWNRNKKVLIGMCTFGAACIVAAVVPSKTTVSQSTNLYIQAVSKVLNCIGTEGTVPTAIQFICLILYEMGMLGLSWIAFWRMRRRNPPSRLIMTLYRDSFIYLTAILAFSVINAVVTLTAPIQYSDFLYSPQVVMHSILASRIFFNLRETTREQKNMALPVTLTEFHTMPSGFSISLGRTSYSRTNPATMIDTTRVIDITRESALES